MSDSEDPQLPTIALASVRNNGVSSRLSASYHRQPPHPHHLMYLKLRMLGHLQAEAAAVVKRSWRACQRWEASEWWPIALQEQLDRMVREKPAAFAKLHEKAMAGLSKQIDEGNPTAMMYVLDQFYGRPVARVESKSETSTKITMESVMLQLTAKLQERQAHASGSSAEPADTP